jgi:hypothetical protein
MSKDMIVVRCYRSRIIGFSSALVRVRDTLGESREFHKRLHNFRVRGLHVCLRRPVERDSSLSAITRAAGVEIRASGILPRVESRTDNSLGPGVRLEDHHLLSAQPDRGDRGFIAIER